MMGDEGSDDVRQDRPVTGPSPDDSYGEQEAAERFNAALRAALNTPPKPAKDRPRERPESKGKGRRKVGSPA